SCGGGGAGWGVGGCWGGCWVSAEGGCSASSAPVIVIVALGADGTRKKLEASFGLTNNPPLVPAQIAPSFSDNAKIERPCNSATSAHKSAPFALSLVVSLNNPRLVPHQVSPSEAWSMTRAKLL